MQKDLMDRLLWKEIERQSKILSPLTPPLDVWPWDRMGLQPLTRPEDRRSLDKPVIE